MEVAMDIFLEYMVKKKKDAADYFYIAAMILSGIITSVLVLYISAFFISYTMGLQFLVVAFIWYGVCILIRRRNVEYEYSFTNGVLDVDAIYAKRKRSHILTVKARDMLLCAPVYSGRFQEQYLNVKGLKRSYLAVRSMGERGLYFADFITNAERVRLIFGPPHNMISNMKKYNPNNIHLLDESHPS